MDSTHWPHVPDRLNDERIRLCDLLRSRVSKLNRPQCSNDAYLTKWLKARDWDVDEAESLLRKHINWRLVNKIDALLVEYIQPTLLRLSISEGICGQDKAGRPLVISLLGKLDIKGLLESFSPRQLITDRVFLLEYLFNRLLFNKTGRLSSSLAADQVVLLIDAEGISIGQHLSPSWISILIELLQIAEANYPELLHSCIVINTPTVFDILFRLIKPFISQRTRQKICLLKSDYKSYLLQHFNAADLPAYFGGTMTDPDGDPRCPSRLCWGGKVIDIKQKLEVLSSRNV